MDTYISFNPLVRDNIHIDRVNTLFKSILHDEVNHYPPFNIEKNGEDSYSVVIAVPGFQDMDLNITFQNNQLKIFAKGHLQKNKEYLHRGIDIIPFELNFKLDNHMQVLGAELNNGLLYIQLRYELPEEARPRMIPIDNSNKIETRVIEDKSRKKTN